MKRIFEEILRENKVIWSLQAGEKYYTNVRIVKIFDNIAKLEYVNNAGSFVAVDLGKVISVVW